jgi:glucokinase
MQHQTILGIDIGGTKCAVALGRSDGKIIARKAIPTEVDRLSPQEVLERLAAIARELLTAAKDQTPPIGAGVSCGGPLDTRAGVIHSPPNMPEWKAVPVRAFFEKALKLPVRVENDANATALAEWKYGAGKGTRNFVFLTMGTGIGGGLILNGQLFRGADGAAGELGHVTVDDNGPPHNCGMVGCIEVMASGTAIARMAHEAVAAGRSEMLARAAATGELTAREVGAAAEAGDAVAQEILMRAAHYLGVGLAGYVNIFNPEVIVLGGGVTRIGRRFLDPAFNLARERAFRLPAGTVQFKLAALAGKAEVLGVAALARESA